MKILIIGGMHGNEPLGLELIKKFSAQPINNIKVLAANEEAIKINKRYANQDLNRSFPGNSNSKIYEEKRAVEILKECSKYDLVLDFHNTHCPNNDCSFIGESATSTLLDISSWLGLTKVIVADYECINKYAVNCLSVEISLSSSLMNVELWYNKIVSLSKLAKVSREKNIQKYRFIYRMTLEDKERLQLDKMNLKAFVPLKKELTEMLSIKSTAYPIFIGDEYTPYNYGGVLVKYTQDESNSK